MTSLRRRLSAALLVPLVLSLSAPSSGAQAAPPGAPVQPSIDEAGGRVDSWALAPAGDPDPEKAGNRPSLSYAVDPGATVKDAITLYNFGNVQLTYAVYATDARNNNDGGFDALKLDDEPKDGGSWIKLNEANVTVAPGNQVTMPIEIKIPADAKPGDHVAAILAQNDATGTAPDGKVVNLERRTGTRVYIRVSGPLAPELAVESVTTSYSPKLNPLDGTANVSYTIHNRGNVRLAGTYEVSISGPFGLFKERVKAKDLEELLPGEDVRFTTKIDGVAATGIAFAKVSIKPVTTEDLDVATSARTGVGLALPVTIILLALALWLGLRARRSYKDHQTDGRGPVDPGALPAEPAPKEPQLT